MLSRRNRYYDPATGRFTQGLARGGLNLYGLAGGDPVNYNDPFGLCPPDDDKPCPAQQLVAAGKAWLQNAMAAVGDFGKLLLGLV